MKTVARIVEQHAADAAFFAALRDRATHAPNYSAPDLRTLDGRLDGNLDGLRIAGDAGWAAAQQELGWKGAGEVFVGTVLAAQAGRAKRFDEVLAVAAEDLGNARGMASGLGWIEDSEAEPWIARLAGSAHPVHRRIAVSASAIRRRDPGPALARWLEDADPGVRARAARAAGELGRWDAAARLVAMTRDGDPGVAFWSAWAGALLGETPAANVLCAVADGGGPFAARAGDLAARALRSTDGANWRAALAHDPGKLRLAIGVAGALGDPALAPWLIEQMRVDVLARPAGEAFSSITGVDLAYSDLDRDQLQGLVTVPNDDPSHPDVAMDPDEDLTFPHPDRVAAWWEQHRGEFPTGTHLLLGRPISPAACARSLRTGKQRQRAAAAIETALLSPGKPLFEVREHAYRQLARLRD